MTPRKLVEELRRMALRYQGGNSDYAVQLLCDEAADVIEELLDEAKEEGYHP